MLHPSRDSGSNLAWATKSQLTARLKLMLQEGGGTLTRRHPTESSFRPPHLGTFPPPPHLFSADCKRGRWKGATSKKRQKSSKSVKKFFDTFRQFSRRAKNVKNRQKVSKSFSTLFDNFRAAPFFRPLLQSADIPFISLIEALANAQNFPRLTTFGGSRKTVSDGPSSRGFAFRYVSRPPPLALPSYSVTCFFSLPSDCQ